jgi:membrane protease YdiL (CAAX protease family)
MDQNNTPAPSIPLWQTIVFTLLALVVFLFAQTSALQHYTDSQVANFPEMDRTALLKLMSSDATAVSIVSIVGGIVATAFLLLIIHLRGLPIKQYLSVQAFSKRDLINWQLVMIGFIALTSLVAYLISHQTSDFMVRLWETCDNVILLLIAVAIVAPIFEECLFRGFLFSGLQQSHLGTGAAIVFSSAAWAVIHTQYGTFDLISVFAFGIILATARVASRSLLLPIALHGTFNFFAVLEMALFN